MLKQEMLLMVRALYFCMEDTWDKIGKKYDISPAQQHILFLLSTNGNKLTPSKIGELGCWHPSTVSRLINRLQKNGYIKVNADKSSRFKMVSMTDEGKQLLEQLLDAAKAMEEFPFDMQHLSEQEILTFLECGQKILEVQKGKDFRQNVISKRVDNYDYA
ncbi:MarR family winged helix-turn-helix transcriptional regulator [Bacillus dakarensis]|uniref:MarR family winged helix-turn-helix transcriptional regulator n=1 Tax=Robertmurraya dakarensis TaxID=1926278 RepID=UPI000982504A|nr:MarR family transcriptional regulator [Bacillus dakarensis]